MQDQAAEVRTSDGLGRFSLAPRRAGVVLGLAVVLILLGVTAAFLRVASSAASSSRRLAGQTAVIDSLTRRLGATTSQLARLSSRVLALEPKVDTGLDVTTVATAVGPSVFTVDTPDGLGSGWVVKDSGGQALLVTDYHVVASVWEGGGRAVGLRQASGVMTGTIVRVDQGADLALIQVPRLLPALSVDTSPVRVGEAIAAFGSPLDLGGSVTSGIVSGIRPEGIQFTAAISPGNSGGPIVDNRGWVVGVAQAALVGDNAEALNFAIPSARVCSAFSLC